LTSVAPVHPLDLDPSLIGERTYTSRQRRNLIDTGALLSVMIILLCLIPARMIIPQLTDVGRPALVVGLGVALSWAISKLHPRLSMRGPQPLRWAAAGYLAAMLMAYAAGYLRGLPTLEANSADRTIIAVVIFLGVALACADLIPNRARLDDVIRTLVWCGTIMAVIGLIQFLFVIDVTEYIQIPGLVMQGDLIGLAERGDGFYRVSSTATHYIEFSVVMAIGVPFAIHTARFARHPLARQSAAVAAVLMAGAIPATLSRTGILALAVALFAMMFAWDWRTRFNIGVPAIGLLAVLAVVQPGLLGTIRSLFAGISNDPSIQGRTEDYSIVFAYFHDRPWLGRGPGTFVPKLYIILDNEWLQHLVNSGLIGLGALIGLILTAITLSIIAFRRATRPEDKHLCMCLVAVQLIAVVSNSTFDAFGFTTYSTLLALFTGAAGAMWRFTHPARQVRSATTRLVTETPTA
jgi:O-antigen ligase